MNTITFGLAPFLAKRCLEKLADDEGEKLPIAAHILKTDLYLDNLLTGADNIEKTHEIRNQIDNLLKADGLNLRQWASNNSKILDGLSADQIDTSCQVNRAQTLKTLGISWSAREDQIVYKVNFDKVTLARSKRSILPEIAKIFDPLGLLSPIILYTKSIVQEIWKERLN